jgi:hypothetical protein
MRVWLYPPSERHLSTLDIHDIAPFRLQRHTGRRTMITVAGAEGTELVRVTA